MNFRDFIRNRFFRRRTEKNFERDAKSIAPNDCSRRRLSHLVSQLLDDWEAIHAFNELKTIGRPVLSVLLEALNDPRYRELTRKTSITAPFDMVLELLVPIGPEHVLTVVLPLVSSPSIDVRRTVARALASLGRDETIPVLAKLLDDPDGWVRSAVEDGVYRALSDGRSGDEFRRRMYELFLDQCDKDWKGATNETAALVVKLDRERRG